MSSTQSFEEFIKSHTADISLLGLSVNILLAALLCMILAWVYVHFGTTLSNRRTLARNFLLVGVTTTLIITVVKSSLALSLGLVGALSIVRFRAAIKEPEELGYLFLTIAIGLGLGADQRGITIVAFALIVVLLLAYRIYAGRAEEPNNLFLKVCGDSGDGPFDIEGLVGEMSQSCRSVSLRRYEERDGGIEAVFIIALDDFGRFAALRDALRSRYGALDLTFVEEARLA